MQNEKITVVVPIYNTEEYLNQCIKSILNQTYKNLEILLINDGSTDKSLSICQLYAENDDRIKVINNHNIGIGATRNLAISIANGKYITFIDSDDFVTDHYIENLYKTAIETNSDITSSNYYTLNEKNSTFYFHINKESRFTKTYSPYEWFKNQCNPNNNFQILFNVPWAKLYQRNIFKTVRYPETIKTDDEYTTWKLYLNASKITYINTNDYCYRLRSKSNSHTIGIYSRLPTDSLEERLTIEHLIGFPTQDLEKEYIKRLTWLKKDLLSDGQLNEYKNVSFKLDCLQKYRKYHN